MSDLTRERVAEVVGAYLADGAVDSILDELFPDEPSPRTWSIPAKPGDVRYVEDSTGERYDLHEHGERAWMALVYERGKLTEVVESEVEAAARRLREWTSSAATPYEGVTDDVETLVAHFLDGGSL